MKRDMDIVRQILFHLEKKNNLNEFSGYESEEIIYHVSLLEEAGLITQEFYQNMYLNNSFLDGIRITWIGHEFLDAARKDSMWEKAKKACLEKTGSISFEMVKAILVQISKEAVFT